MIRFLRTFSTAARYASFSGAGARLGLSQSAVSAQIKKLEQELNCELFERVGKAVALSPRGRELLPVAQEILRLYESMKGQPETEAVSGRINFGAISTAQLDLLPDALLGFRARFPHIEINIVPGTSIQFLSLIDAQELDIAMMIKPTLKIPKTLRWTPLLREAYVAVAPPGTPGTPGTPDMPVRELLRRHPFVRYSPRSYGGQLVEKYLKRQRLQVNDILQLDEPAVILETVEKGLGVSIVPYGTAWGRQPRGLRVLPLEGGGFFREIGILQTERMLRNAGAQALVANLAETVAARDFTLPAPAQAGKAADAAARRRKKP